MGVKLGAEHDGKADDDKNDDKEEVGNVAESLPDTENGVEASKAQTLGVGRLGQAGVDVVKQVGDVDLVAGGLVFDHKIYGGEGFVEHAGLEWGREGVAQHKLFLEGGIGAAGFEAGVSE